MRSGSYCYACSGCGPAVRSEIMTTMATSAQHSIVVDVPAHAFYEVITDFARYPEYLTSVTAVDILRHQGNEWDVAFNVRVLRNIDYTVRHVGVPALILHVVIAADVTPDAADDGDAVARFPGDARDGRTEIGVDVALQVSRLRRPGAVDGLGVGDGIGAV